MYAYKMYLSRTYCVDNIVPFSYAMVVCCTWQAMSHRLLQLLSSSSENTATSHQPSPSLKTPSTTLDSSLSTFPLWLEATTSLSYNPQTDCAFYFLIPYTEVRLIEFPYNLCHPNIFKSRFKFILKEDILKLKTIFF